MSNLFLAVLLVGWRILDAVRTGDHENFSYILVFVSYKMMIYNGEECARQTQSFKEVSKMSEMPRLLYIAFFLYPTG